MFQGKNEALCPPDHGWIQILTPVPVCMSYFVCSMLSWVKPITHGFMLKRSLPASGVASVDPLSAVLLSFQAEAPPVDPLGDLRLVGLVGEEAFLLWISCTWVGLETATDWERDTVTWQCDGMKDRKEMPVSMCKSLANSGQWGVIEQPVHRGTQLWDRCSCYRKKTSCKCTREGPDMEVKGKNLKQIQLFLFRRLWQHYLIFWLFCNAGSFLSAGRGEQGRWLFTPNGPTGWVCNALDLHY